MTETPYPTSTPELSTLRRSHSQRVTTMVWGTLIVAFSGFVFADLLGSKIDYELVGIGALAVLGAWILVSAFMPRR